MSSFLTYLIIRFLNFENFGDQPSGDQLSHWSVILLISCPVVSCPSDQLSGGQLSGGQLSGDQLSGDQLSGYQ